MSSFTIKFNANTTGTHHVGYRTYNDPPNTYTVIDVDVTTPGLQEITIDVPGNLYCASAGIEYSGYVISDCQDQTDDNGDGIPDLAQTWTIQLVQQDDPCQKTTIKCVAVPIESVIIVDSGTSACETGNYPVTVTEATPGDEVEAADINCDIVDGKIVKVNIVNGGKYKDTPNLSVSIPGCTSTPSLAAVFGDCPVLDLDDYDCAGSLALNEDAKFVLSLGETVLICMKPPSVASLPLPNNFEAINEGRCHCEKCANVVVSVPGATTGVGKITYQICWDNSNPQGSALQMISRKINWDESIDLGCIIPDTLNIEQGSLDVMPVAVESSCN